MDKKYEQKSLMDTVFSWSIEDILNKNLYKEKIRTIPDRFSSVEEYYQCFVPLLLEETRTELLSGFESLPKAPMFGISSIETLESHRGVSNLFHKISLIDANYKPKCGDIIALSNARPSCISALEPLLLLAHVFSVDNDRLILVSSSRPISPDEKCKLSVGVYVMNLTTNTRTWDALHHKHNGRNLTLIKTVLLGNIETEHRVSSLSRGNDLVVPESVSTIIRSSNMNPSQEDAIFSCIAARNHTVNSTRVKLIWGPPGTGKTKTVATLLFALLELNCKTLVCALTNTAVVEVVSRLLRLVLDSSEHHTYGLGDIVLSGNRIRMGIDDNDDLRNVFLDHRIAKLCQLVSPYVDGRRDWSQL